MKFRSGDNISSTEMYALPKKLTSLLGMRTRCLDGLAGREGRRLGGVLVGGGVWEVGGEDGGVPAGWGAILLNQFYFHSG